MNVYSRRNNKSKQQKGYFIDRYAYILRQQSRRTEVQLTTVAYHKV